MGASSASAWRDRSAPVELEVGFVGLDGRQVRMGLAEGVPVRFEAVAPVRAFPSFKRQRYFPGLWWSATTRRQVGYESWPSCSRRWASSTATSAPTPSGSPTTCLLYTSDAADEEDSVDLGGRRIIKKKKKKKKKTET